MIAALNLSVILGSEVLFSKDLLRCFYPFKGYLRERLLAGDFPLWTPLLGLGIPFAALPEVGAFYPLNALLFLPWPASIGIFLVSHLLLAAWGTFRFLKEMALGPAACAFGTMGFSLSGYVLSMFSTSGLYLMGIAWMPVALFLARRILAGSTVYPVIGLGLATACQILTGEVQSTVFTALFIVSIGIAERRYDLRSVLRLLTSGLIGIALSAHQLILSISHLQLSRRASGISLDEAAALSLHPLRLLETAVFGLLGATADMENYIGLSLNALGHGRTRVLPWSASVYMGSVVLVFLLSALFRPRKLPRWAIAVGVVGVTGLLLALGDRTPLFGLYHRVLPLAGYFRYPEKLFVLTAFAAPVIAAVGVDRWRTFSRERESRGYGLYGSVAAACAALLGLLACTGLVSRYLIGKDPHVETLAPGVVIARAILTEISLLLAAGGGLWLIRRRWPHRTGVVAAVAVTVQMTIAQAYIVRRAPRDLYPAKHVVAEALRERSDPNRPVRLINSPFSPPLYAGCVRSQQDVERAYWLQTILALNTGLLYDIGQYHAYVGMGSAGYPQFWKVTKPFHRRLMDLLSIPYGMFPLDHEVTRDPSIVRILGERIPCLFIGESRTALPLIRPVEAMRQVPSVPAAIDRLGRDEAVGRGAVVLVEADPLPWRQPPARPVDKAEEGCRATSLSTDGVTGTCTVATPRIVVINVAYHPFLVASADGNPSPLVKANGIVSAMRLEPGTHRIEIRYREPYLPVGLGISLTALILSLGVLAATFRKTSRHPHPSATALSTFRVLFDTATPLPSPDSARTPFEPTHRSRPSPEGSRSPGSRARSS